MTTEPSAKPHTMADSVLVVEDYEGGAALLEPFLQDGNKTRHTGDEGEAPHHPNAGGATFVRTCFNGLNALSGVGILSVPYALSEGGWLSLVLFFMMAIIFYYTGLLLQRCMDADPSIKSYPDIGEAAFGYKGRVVVSVFMYLELYLLAIGFLILEGDNLDKLFPDTSLKIGTMRIAGRTCFVMLVAVLILPTTWLRSLGVLAYVSIGGVLASVIVVGSVLWAAIVDGVGFHERGRLLNLRGMSTALGLYAFCYSGHSVFPTLSTSMKNNGKFSKVLLLCFGLCTLNYGSMAVLGYLMYGEDVQSQITLNLPAGKLSTKIAISTTLISPMTKYGLMISPIAIALEERLLSHNKRSGSLLIRTTMVLSTVIIALVIPLFGNLMALLGSFLGITVCMLFPCICYLKIFGASRISRAELAFIIGILLVGIFVGITGTYSSLRDIIYNF